MKQVKIFPEGQSLHLVNRRPTTEVGHSPVNVQYGRTRKKHLHVGIGIIHLLQLHRPIGILVDFVYEQMAAALLAEIIRQVYQCMVCKIDIVCRDIQCILHGKILLDVLQEKRGLPHSTRSYQAQHTAVPLDFIILIPGEVRIYLFQQSAEVCQ